MSERWMVQEVEIRVDESPVSFFLFLSVRAYLSLGSVDETFLVSRMHVSQRERTVE